MKKEMKNEEAVSPVIATILMVAITVVLAGVLYVWASSLAGDSTGDTLDTYVFTAEDANPNADPAAAEPLDNLVRVGMQSGSGLNWGTLQVTIKIDGGTPMTCQETTIAEENAKCTYEKYGDSGNDQNWEVGEGITIKEGDVADCTKSCNVEVTLIKQGAGDTEDKTLGVVSSSA